MKKGDKVLVYGIVVDWRKGNPIDCKAEYWFLRGSLAKIISVINKSELTIKFLKDKTCMRNYSGLVTEVHPKQCRLVK
jgi:hypothetical protein